MPFDEEELLEVMIDDQTNQPYGNPVYINGGLNNRKIVAEMAFQSGSPPQPTEGVGGYPKVACYRPCPGVGGYPPEPLRSFIHLYQDCFDPASIKMFFLELIILFL